MKRVVLATITQAEAEAIESAERNYNTFLTLLQNIFLSDDEKKIVTKSLPELQQISNSLYENVLAKYNIPYETDLRYRLSVKHEVFVEVY